MPSNPLIYYLSWAILISCAITSCGPEQPQELRLLLSPIDCPSSNGGEPNLFVSANGQFYLSWIEFVNDSTDALQFSRMVDGQWEAPSEIARGSDWFVNWADFPSLAGQESWLAAHWLQKSAQRTYDYDVRVSTSTDAGEQWSEPFVPHTDGVAAEHGFVSMLPLPNERIFATWLDGRNTKTEGHAEGHEHGGSGAMTLRCAEFDAYGQLYAEAELDERVCDCCQTDVALTSNGPVVVYRNRSKEELRDISIVRRVGKQWSKPQVIHPDNWEIAGCPVNGPAIAARNEWVVVVAWFTAAAGEVAVKVAFSEDAGASFSPPIRVDNGQPAGRVDVELLDNNEALVIWLATEGEQASIQARVIPPSGPLPASVALVESHPSRRSGFPILAQNNNQLLLAWTAVKGDSTRVKTGVIE